MKDYNFEILDLHENHMKALGRDNKRTKKVLKLRNWVCLILSGITFGALFMAIGYIGSTETNEFNKAFPYMLISFGIACSSIGLLKAFANKRFYKEFL